jgi:hypothetical protein
MTLKWMPGLPMIVLVFLTAFLMREDHPAQVTTPEALPEPVQTIAMSD